MKYTFLTLCALTLSFHIDAAHMAQTRRTRIDTLFNIAQYKSEGMVYESLRNFFQQHPDLADHALKNEHGQSFIAVICERFKNNNELLSKIIELLLDEPHGMHQSIQERAATYRFMYISGSWQQVLGPYLPDVNAANANASMQDDAVEYDGPDMDDIPTLEPVTNQAIDESQQQNNQINQNISAEQQRVGRVAAIFQCKTEEEFKKYNDDNCRSQ